MQILYAAPFIFLAAVVFSAFSVVPRARGWALPIPTGIVGAGPFSLMGLGAGALWIRFSGAGVSSPMGRGTLIAFFCGGAVTGVAGGILTWVIARWVASILSAMLLRLAVFIAGWCSYLAVLGALLLWADYYFQLKRTGLVFGVEVVLAGIAAWFISERFLQFRPRRASDARQ